MKCLVVIAHPLADSLCHALARTAIATLMAAGHEVEVEDLCASGFQPALTAAEALVLVFPTWWFGFPAVLKGWFDRVWAPGMAYDHASDLGPIRPRLHDLRRTLAITSLGSPWWVDRLVLRQPVRRVLKTALLGTCAPACRFEMLSLYKAERLTAAQVAPFRSRIEHTLSRWA